MDAGRESGTVFCPTEKADALTALFKALPGSKLASVHCKVRASAFSSPSYGRAVLLKGNEHNLAAAAKGITAFLTKLSYQPPADILWKCAADPEAEEDKQGSKPMQWDQLATAVKASVNRYVQHIPSGCWMPAWLATLWQDTEAPELIELPELMPAAPAPKPANAKRSLGLLAARQAHADQESLVETPEELVQEAQRILRVMLSPTLNWHLAQHLGEFYADCVDFREWSVLHHMENQWNAVLNDLFSPHKAFEVRQAIGNLIQAFKSAKLAKADGMPLDCTSVVRLAADVCLLFVEMPPPEGNKMEARNALDMLMEGKHFARTLHAKCQTLHTMAGSASLRLGPRRKASTGPIGASNPLISALSLQSSSSEGFSASDRPPASSPPARTATHVRLGGNEVKLPALPSTPASGHAAASKSAPNDLLGNWSQTQPMEGNMEGDWSAVVEIKSSLAPAPATMATKDGAAQLGDWSQPQSPAVSSNPGDRSALLDSISSAAQSSQLYPNPAHARAAQAEYAVQPQPGDWAQQQPLACGIAGAWSSGPVIKPSTEHAPAPAAFPGSPKTQPSNCAQTQPSAAGIGHQSTLPEIRPSKVADSAALSAAHPQKQTNKPDQPMAEATGNWGAIPVTAASDLNNTDALQAAAGNWSLPDVALQTAVSVANMQATEAEFTAWNPFQGTALQVAIATEPGRAAPEIIPEQASAALDITPQQTSAQQQECVRQPLTPAPQPTADPVTQPSAAAVKARDGGKLPKSLTQSGLTFANPVLQDISPVIDQIMVKPCPPTVAEFGVAPNPSSVPQPASAAEREGSIASKVQPSAEDSSWIEKVNIADDMTADKCLTFQGMMKVATYVLRDKIKKLKGPAPKERDIQYGRRILLPATTACAKNLALLAGANHKEAIAKELNTALLSMLKNICKTSSATDWHTSKMFEVMEFMGKKAARSQPLWPEIAAELSRLNLELEAALSGLRS